MKTQKDFPVFREKLEMRRKELKMTRNELSQKSGVSVRTLNSWVNKGTDPYGNEGYKPPSFGALLRVAAALGVSVDYLTNKDMNCLTVSHQMIHDVTGLSDASISALETYHEDDFMHSIPEITDILLSTDKGCQLLLLLHAYLMNDYVGFCEDGKISDMVTIYNASNHTQDTLNASQLSTLNLLHIQEILPQLKNELQSSHKKTD